MIMLSHNTSRDYYMQAFTPVQVLVDDADAILSLTLDSRSCYTVCDAQPDGMESVQMIAQIRDKKSRQGDIVKRDEGILSSDADQIRGARKWKPLALALIIPVVLSGFFLLVRTVPTGSLAQTARDYLFRVPFDLDGVLQKGEMLPSPPGDLGQTTTITPTETIWKMLAEVDRERAEAALRRLTGEEPLCIRAGCYTLTHRLTGSEDLGWATDYLYENLAALGYTVEFQHWSRSGHTDRNLIARKTGVLTPTEEIYLVAHADGAKGSAERHPAADDNASSVVNGLELARVFSDHIFGRTIVLFFSTGEEQGTQGARYYLDGLSPSELNAIKYVINRDVTGYDANGDAVMVLGHGDHPPSVALAQVMSAVIDAYQLDLNPHVIASCP
jgi:hypothetical protein